MFYHACNQVYGTILDCCGASLCIGVTLECLRVVYLTLKILKFLPLPIGLYWRRRISKPTSHTLYAVSDRGAGEYRKPKIANRRISSVAKATQARRRR